MKEDLDGIIKRALAKRASGAKWERTLNCPSELELADYLEGVLPRDKRQKIEVHLADCFYCLDLLVVGKEAISGYKPKPRPFQNLSKHKWLFGASLCFILSFLFSRYFLQFLVATLILGAKWVLQGEGAKNLVMIFRSLRKEEREEIPTRKNF